MAARRRQSSIKPMRARAQASDDRRLSRIESDLQQVQQSVDVNIKRIAALQAQLDHLAAKIRPA